jgi:OOP family OmpA-OmpF porin
MKKLFLSLILVSSLTIVNAQTETEKSTESSFNKWSVEVNGGVNRSSRPFTAEYFSKTPSFFNVDLGVRHMFNSKFGVKTDIGFYRMQSHKHSLPFTTEYSRANFQGVLNFGRIMNFEEFTKSFNILFHTGIGYYQFRTKDTQFTDSGANFIVGITGQIKLSDKIVLNTDVTSTTNTFQNYSFDGKTDIHATRRGFEGGIFSASVGLTFYLGKNVQHADWYVESKNEEWKKKVSDLEKLMNDSDKDGVPDYLDTEPNTLAGVAVNTKGIAIDKNNNGVPDEIESYMNKTYGDGKQTGKEDVYKSNNELVKNFINEGYITVYFDFDKSVPTNVSTEGIDFILTYLRNNPTASVDIIGHADELGKSTYNNKLSVDRSNNVKNVLIKAKIAESRLNVVPAGEDTSVEKDSELARRLVRRVTFRVK